MMYHSIEPRNQIFVKGYRFLSFAKNMNTNIGKNKSKILSDKYSQKLLNHPKQFVTETLKTASKRAIKKTAEETSNLIGNKITIKITKSFQQCSFFCIKQLQRADKLTIVSNKN